MIWAIGGGDDDDRGEQIGAILRSTVAEPSSEPTQLAAISGFFSEYLKATKKRITGKRSKSIFMVAHYILCPITHLAFASAHEYGLHY
jgi:hypothetical protein